MKMLPQFWISWILFIAMELHHTMALNLTHLAVPEVVDYRETAKLSCSYNMGKYQLNSVKWYKNEMEFFRFAPMMYPSVLKFKVDGVSLRDGMHNCNQITCTVTLDQLDPQTSGAYRCEISGDAPEFKLVSRTANMTVAALPRHDPNVNGLSGVYAYGDFVQANCTTDISSPPATLSWYINDEQAPPDILQPQQETTIHSNGFALRYRSLEIRFIIDQSRFGDIKSMDVKCLAKMERFPRLTRAKSTKVYIVSEDELNNEKLVNWRYGAATEAKLNLSLCVVALAYFAVTILCRGM